MDECERRIKQEREDRVKYHDDHLNPIRAQLANIQAGLIKERKDRITNEKKNIQEIKDESQKMQDLIKEESDTRKRKLGDLDDQMTQDTDLCNKFLDNFERDAGKTADKLLGDLDSEITNRFKHQDEILDNMSTIWQKYLDVLRIE